MYAGQNIHKRLKLIPLYDRCDRIPHLTLNKKYICLNLCKEIE